MSKERSKYTVADLEQTLYWIKENLRLNKLRPEDVEVRIKESWHKYPIFTSSFGFGRKAVVEFEFFKSDEIIEVAPDSRPDTGGEFWKSRGCGIGGNGKPDCSGFVVSKLAGERLRRLVRYVLEKDEIDSYLDYREYEPTYIQFKFSSTEFDVEKLDELSTKNNGILTEQILRECKNKDKEPDKDEA